MEQDNVSCSKVKVSLPDGSTLELCSGITVAEAAAKISPRLASKAVLALVDGEVHDLHYRIESDCNLALLMEGDERSVDAPASYRGAHNGAGREAPVPQRPAGDWACHLHRLLLRFRQGRLVLPGGTSRPSRRRCARSSPRTCPSFAREMPREQAIAELSASDEVYKVELVQELPR